MSTTLDDRYRTSVMMCSHFGDQRSQKSARTRALQGGRALPVGVLSLQQAAEGQGGSCLLFATEGSAPSGRPKAIPTTHANRQFEVIGGLIAHEIREKYGGARRGWSGSTSRGGRSRKVNERSPAATQDGPAERAIPTAPRSRIRRLRTARPL